MLLRLAVVALLLLNGGYWLWSRGDLAGFGLAPAGLDEREPQRLSRQIHPEYLQIRKEPPNASPGGGSASAPP